MDQQQQIEALLKKIQQGFYDQDNEIFKIVSSSRELLPSLSNLHTIRERKRVILNVIRFSIFMRSLCIFVCLFFILIIFKSLITFEVQFNKDFIYRFCFLSLFIYALYKLISSTRFNLKIINSVKYLDEFMPPNSITTQRQKIENAQDYNYQRSKTNSKYLKRRFAQQRRKIQIIGCIIASVSLLMLIYCFLLPPASLFKSVMLLPFFLMVGIGTILSPGIHNDELKFLYGTEKPSFKFYPKPLKVCLIISLFLCFLMDLWRQGLFSIYL